MTLSDKIDNYDEHCSTLLKEDVKQFIKELKSFIVGNTDQIGIRREIDKLVGDKLI